MKKRFLVLLTVVLVMLCFVLVGCVVRGGENEGENGNEAPQGEAFYLNPRLINVLFGYLETVSNGSELPDTRLAYKIDMMSSAWANPVLITVDPEDYYFVGVYCESPHEEEKEAFCCITSYSFLGFSCETSLPEYYNGKELVAAFQINRTQKCENIFGEEKGNLALEHYEEYTPIFENGMNTAEALVCDDKFIYIGSKNDSQVYANSSFIMDRGYVMNYIEIDGKQYVGIFLCRAYSEEEFDESVIETTLRYEFGDYYDSLSEMMITDKYAPIDYWGYISKYAIFEMKEFTDFIKELRSGN